MDKLSPATMSAARFADLTDAYGSRLDRWPVEHRTAGGLFAATDEGRAILGRAVRLDSLLDHHVVPAPSAAIRNRVLDAIPVRKTLSRRLRGWWAGAGLVGVGLAGALTGVLAMSIALPGPMPDETVGTDQIVTIFGDISETPSMPQEAQ